MDLDRYSLATVPGGTMLECHDCGWSHEHHFDLDNAEESVIADDALTSIAAAHTETNHSNRRRHAKDEFRAHDLDGPRGYMVHDAMCDRIDQLQTPEIEAVLDAAIAWDHDRIPKTATSTFNAAQRLSVAVGDLLLARSAATRHRHGQG